MNERKYRTHPEAFKLEALALLKKHEKSAGEIERELGITPGLLVKWRARYQAVQKSRHEIHPEPATWKRPRPRSVACSGRWPTPRSEIS